MARLLVGDEWYEEISSTSLYEGQYEAILAQHAPLIFPSYHAVTFKSVVESEYGVARPDLALVRHDYAEWWVVEVELAHHGLDAHVLPQVRKLATAQYGELHAAALCAELPALDRRRVGDMMKGRQPRVLVVVNSPRPEWGRALARYDAALTVFEVFRSERNRHVFRVNGDRVVSVVDVLSECFLEPQFPRFLRVLSPGALPVPDQSGVLRIHYNGALTAWSRIDGQDAVWLDPEGPSPLSPRTRYELVREGDAGLALRMKGSRKER